MNCSVEGHSAALAQVGAELAPHPLLVPAVAAAAGVVADAEVLGPPSRAAVAVDGVVQRLEAELLELGPGRPGVSAGEQVLERALRLLASPALRRPVAGVKMATALGCAAPSRARLAIAPAIGGRPA